MRILAAAAFLALLAMPAAAQEVTSVYTDLDQTKNCITIDKAGEGDGDWSTLTCDGYRGFPVIVGYDDQRQSVSYGFIGDTAWESFDGFNSVGDKIEWRLRTESGKTTPFATIARWTVADPQDATKKVEVLVVSRVAQLSDGAGCTVGLVRATGDPDANEKARKIADDQATDFSCGDERTLVGDPMPAFTRSEAEDEGDDGAPPDDSTETQPDTQQPAPQ